MFFAAAVYASMSGMDPILEQAAAAPAPMETLLTRYSQDESALGRLHPLSFAPASQARWQSFYDEWKNRLQNLSFEPLSRDGKADWALLNRRVQARIDDLAAERAKIEDAAPLLKGWDRALALINERKERRAPEPKSAAAQLDLLRKDGEELRESLKKGHGHNPQRLRRASLIWIELRRSLGEWHGHTSGYDPEFTWWTERPWKDTDRALSDLIQALKKAAAPEGMENPDDAIIGDAIGREALLQHLDAEFIAYSPEELIEIGKREAAWCDEEMRKAARELGFGDDWRAALEHVKGLHEAPGDQPDRVVQLAEEAIAYLEKHDLLTIPPMAKEVWRMQMMSAERQKVSPFFLGGEQIIVSFPTHEMTHEEKMMSLRANNIHFSRATVHHELIPGHQMQAYTRPRWNAHRRPLDTPFWVEGWALYWEFLFYKQGFITTPEDRIGFLFWRRHRAARIVFSLSFHLGQMTPQECIEMLVNDVGHERSTAEGEVRRSLAGDYPPLYQAAYMLGAIQMWGLRRELVETGKMPEKEFHDRVLRGGSMPFSLIRPLLSGEDFDKSGPKPWRFDDGLPVGRP
jgi:hypothetical protein